MKWYFILLIVTCILLALVLITSYVCFYLTFYIKKRPKSDDFNIPGGEVYKPHKEIIIEGIKRARTLPHIQHKITSFDGLNLYANYYEYDKNAPIEIMFHGYRGDAERDLGVGIERAHKVGHNAFIIHQRACGLSEGKVTSFGVNEKKDCLRWVDYVIETFGEDVRIILTGISMGAATVLMASGCDLPKNVIGVLADCGYNKASDIIKKVVKDMKLPANFFYPFIKLGARLFGKFNLEEFSPFDGVSKTKLPIIFFHGDIDDLVPCDMSEKLYNACNSKKRLVTIKNAGHGLCYLIDPEKYINEVKDFFKE